VEKEADQIGKLFTTRSYNPYTMTFFTVNLILYLVVLAGRRGLRRNAASTNKRNDPKYG
jgi:hypothetical protein